MNEPMTSPPNFELPTPAGANGNESLPATAETPPAKSTEVTLNNPELGTQTLATGIPPAPTSVPQFSATTDNTAATATSQTVAPAATPQIADDADIIEKEWVEKAKQIVEMSRADPHQQNKEINKFKADYIKKRYNKTIKVSEE